MNTDARRIIAAERIERLRRDARPEARVPGPVRRRAGAMLVTAGLRVAGQCVWFVAAEAAPVLARGEDRRLPPRRVDRY